MDIESKKFLGQPKNFVSIFNALLFDGQSVLKPEYLKDENSELVMNVSSKHVDIIKRYEDGTYLDLFVIEKAMSIRLWSQESWNMKVLLVCVIFVKTLRSMYLCIQDFQ